MAIVESRCLVDLSTAGRIDRIVQSLTGRSRADVRGLFDEECVLLNGTPCSEPGMIAQDGNVVSVRHDPHRRYHERKGPRPSSAFQLVHEDDALIVVDKSAAILTVPTDRGDTNTLLQGVTRYLSRYRERPIIVHRLDRGTSGLLVMAKDRKSAAHLEDQFRLHAVEREYAAIVAGTMSRDAGTFSSRLATSASLQRYSVRRRGEGESAITHFRVERRLRDATVLRVRLETGRRNQIRVHFAEDGHPVLGDERYGRGNARQSAWKARRLALHAAVLGFRHPATEEYVRFESPMPIEMERFIAYYG